MRVRLFIEFEINQQQVDELKTTNPAITDDVVATGFAKSIHAVLQQVPRVDRVGLVVIPEIFEEQSRILVPPGAGRILS